MVNKIKKSRFNLFDAGVILVILTILAVFLITKASRQTQWINLKLVVANDDWWWEGTPPQWWYAEALSVGDKSRNSFGQEVAEIVDVANFDVGEYRRRIFVDLKVKGTFDRKRGVYLFNYQPLQVGKPLDLNFGKYNVRGIVTLIDQGSFENIYKTKIIEVKVTSVRPWLLDSFKEGLEMKDTKERTLAKILSIEKSSSKALEVFEINGEKETKYPGGIYYDVTMRLQIKVFESGGLDYFIDRSAIKVGNKIWFQFPQTVVKNAEIIKIIQ